MIINDESLKALLARYQQLREQAKSTSTYMAVEYAEKKSPEILASYNRYKEIIATWDEAIKLLCQARSSS